MTTNEFYIGSTAEKLRALEDENATLQARVTELESYLSGVEGLERINEDAAAARIAELEKERDDLKAQAQLYAEVRQVAHPDCIQVSELHTLLESHDRLRNL